MAKIRTRARAVDLLGRQQIAGTQNAISEIFKNAYDAYAENVRIDYFEDDATLVIRDDGIGMTREDFEEKWLVLGTESKAGVNRDAQYRPPNAEIRSIVGEKGIGRLAIALLGRQVLVISRASRKNGLYPTVVSLIHWGLFEMPGLNLDEIEIPLITLDGGSIPSERDVAGLKINLERCVKTLQSQHKELDFSIIISDLRAFQPDPLDLDSYFSNQPGMQLSLKNKGVGTHFIIAPVNPVLDVELNVENRNQDWSFRKQLLGFNDHTFGSIPSQFACSFQRWLPGSLAGEEFLDPSTFFTSLELEKCSDHLLKGHVDRFGQFKGSLRVYNEMYPEIVVPWSNQSGAPTECGCFDIVFGYLMGKESESLLVGDDYSTFSRKLDRIGGLYVYRDGIRVLPYGDFSVDWLEIEKRRSKSAGYYFWSYRRMFGAVLLSREHNSFLQEKAGREGFQQNRSYRELRDILINIFTFLAAEFFREGNERGDLFEKTQAEMRSRAEALARLQKRSRERRKSFEKNLEAFFTKVQAGEASKAVDELRSMTRARMEAASKISDQDRAAAALIRAERDAISELTALKERFTCKKPSGVALTKDLTREWDGYRIEKSKLDLELFSPCEEDIARTLGEVARRARVYVDRRKRLEERLKSLSDDRHKQLQEAASLAKETASDTRKTVFDITQKAMLALDLKVKQIEVELNSTDLDSLTPQKVEALRKGWEDALADIESHHREALLKARDMLAALAENLRASDGEEPAEAMEALEQRMLTLEEEADENFEMVQLGLAVAIINHEFSSAISNVRKSVQDLGHVAQRNDRLRQVYQSIRANFEHLDGHLKLFTPLQRRLYRVPQSIGGNGIENYVKNLFGNRLLRHKVELIVTDSFKESTVKCYPSTLYPAIINLVDNAIYWLALGKNDRRICFDVSGQDFIVANTGPQIEERDQFRIFERGFSRKPGGRGLGLFISSRALAAENMKLAVHNPPPGYSVAFHINAPTLNAIQ